MGKTWQQEWEGGSWSLAVNQKVEWTRSSARLPIRLTPHTHTQPSRNLIPPARLHLLRFYKILVCMQHHHQLETVFKHVKLWRTSQTQTITLFHSLYLFECIRCTDEILLYVKEKLESSQTSRNPWKANSLLKKHRKTPWRNIGLSRKKEAFLRINNGKKPYESERDLG